MWLTLALCTLIGAAPKPTGPGAADTARLYFLAGDLAQAQAWVRQGLKREPKTCGPLNTALAEYAFLANHIDEFNVAQAKSFIELDRKISPKRRGKLTDQAFLRYVTKPLEQARAWAQENPEGALELVKKALAVDAKNEEARILAAELTQGSNRQDAGT